METLAAIVQQVLFMMEILVLKSPIAQLFLTVFKTAPFVIV